MAIMDIILNARDNASQEIQTMVANLMNAEEAVEDVGNATEDAEEQSVSAWTAIGAAVTVAGAALDMMAQAQGEMNVKVQNLSATTGIANGQIRNMATEFSNARRPLGDIVDLMTTASQVGMKTGEEIEKFTKKISDAALASGEEGSEIAKKSVALRRLKVDLDDTNSYMDAYGYLLENTTGGLGGFLDIVNELGPDLQKMNLGVDETAALFGVMEKELGSVGGSASRDLTTAIGEIESEMSTLESSIVTTGDKIVSLKENMAENGSSKEMSEELMKLEKEQASYVKQLDESSLSIDKVLERMGVSVDAYNTENQLVKESADVISERAKAADESITPLEALKAKTDEFIMSNGEGIAVMGDFGVMLLAAGPLMTALSNSTAIQTALTNAGSVANTAFGTTLRFAMGPVGWAILAIGGLIAVGTLLVKNWDTVKEVGSTVFGGIKNFIGGVSESFSGMGEIWGAVWEGMKTAAFAPINLVIGAVNLLIKGMNQLKIDIPSWSPVGAGESLGINIPLIPTLHQGGVYKAPRVGGEGLARLKDGETVIPPGGFVSGQNSSSNGKPLELVNVIDGKVLARMLLPYMVHEIRRAKGGV
jgi:hypothetical protein